MNVRATRKYSEEAVLDGRPIQGVFESAYGGDSFGALGMDNSVPTFTVLSEDVSEDDRRQSIRVRGVDYLVTALEPDGAGDTVLRLERA